MHATRCVWRWVSASTVTTSTIPPLRLRPNLGWITKFVDGKDFIDREYNAKQKAEGSKRRLVGFELVERGIPRHGYKLTDHNSNLIGEVTSGTMSPCLKKGIGMGYVDAAYAAPGTEIHVVIREKPINAVVVKLPFYKK